MRQACFGWKLKFDYFVAGRPLRIAICSKQFRGLGEPGDPDDRKLEWLGLRWRTTSDSFRKRRCGSVLSTVGANPVSQSSWSKWDVSSGYPFNRRNCPEPIPRLSIFQRGPRTLLGAGNDAANRNQHLRYLPGRARGMQ